MHDLSKGANVAMHRGSKALFLCTLALMLALGGCGRRGALEVPATSASAAAPSENDQTGQTAQQQTVKPASNSFPLDFLIK